MIVSQLSETVLTDAAAFQQLEVDYFVGHPNQKLHRTDLQEVPILRMYGVTQQGRPPNGASILS